MQKFIQGTSLVLALAFSQGVSAQEPDVTQLLATDSITATTDIRPFLRPGIPRDLRLAALRRAWVVDLFIRDFRGLQENGWDFNNPDGVPGFGALEPSESAKLIAAHAFSEVDSEITAGPSVDSRRPAKALWKMAMSWLTSISTR